MIVFRFRFRFLRYAELRGIIKICSPATLQEVLPFDASCEEIEVDESLSFLDAFVSTALHNGAQPYVPRTKKKETYDESGKLNYFIQVILVFL